MSTRSVARSRRECAARDRRLVECEEEMLGITSQLDSNLDIASSNSVMAAFILGRPELVTLGEIIDEMLERLRKGDPRRRAIFVEALSVLRRTTGEKRTQGTDGVAKRRPSKGPRCQRPAR